MEVFSFHKDKKTNGLRKQNFSCVSGLVVCFLICIPVWSGTVMAQELGDVTGAQVPDVPDTLSGWEMEWITGLSISQAAYSNWSKGGVNSLTLNGSTRIQLMYQQDKFAYDLQIRTRYGQAMIENDGMRKTDDLLSFRNRFLYGILDEHDFKLFGNFNFDTQLAEGYDYEAGEDGEDVLISDFMAPGYFIQTAGIAYIPDKTFYVEGGLGLKQTVIRDTTLSTRYGLDEGGSFKAEAGVSFGLNFKREIMEDFTYTGNLETFTTLTDAERKTNLSFSNFLVGEVNDYISLLFQFEMIYDPDYSEKVQIGQLLSAGVSVYIF